MLDLTVVDPDGVDISVFCWQPPEGAEVVGGVHIVHGWADHALRYGRLAQRLADEGFVVCTDDHRGHGRTASRAGTPLGDLGPRGMAGAADAVATVTADLAQRVSGRPVFLLGHSWGALLAQRNIRRLGSDLRGCVLSGTTWAPGLKRRGSDPNDEIEGAKTPFDWLSSDEQEVAAYLSDPLCGFQPFPAKGWVTLLGGGRDADIPASFAVLIMNGVHDPVGGEPGARALANHYRECGLRDVAIRCYDNARHEIFNDRSRERASADLVVWLRSHLPGPA